MITMTKFVFSFSSENDMYAYGCPLKFTLSGQTGSNITNTFQFGDGSPVVTEGDEATYTFSQTPGENSKTITITASNPTSTVKKTYLLKFLPRITGLSVGNSGPVKVGKPLTFNVTVQEKGIHFLLMQVCNSFKCSTGFSR